MISPRLASPIVSLVMPNPIRRRRAGASAFERTGMGCDQLDEIGLASGAGLLEQVLEMSLHRRVREPEGRRDGGHAANLNHEVKHAELARRQLIELYQPLGTPGHRPRGLAEEPGRGGG